MRRLFVRVELGEPIYRGGQGKRPDWPHKPANLGAVPSPATIYYD